MQSQFHGLLKRQFFIRVIGIRGFSKGFNFKEAVQKSLLITFNNLYLLHDSFPFLHPLLQEGKLDAIPNFFCGWMFNMSSWLKKDPLSNGFFLQNVAFSFGTWQRILEYIQKSALDLKLKIDFYKELQFACIKVKKHLTKKLVENRLFNIPNGSNNISYLLSNFCL